MNKIVQMIFRTSHFLKVKIINNSTPHPARDTLRLLSHKTDFYWEVNNEEYRKSDDENFDKMFNKPVKITIVTRSKARKED